MPSSQTAYPPVINLSPGRMQRIAGLKENENGTRR
jgi:hypothetical protein